MYKKKNTISQHFPENFPRAIIFPKIAKRNPQTGSLTHSKSSTFVLW